MDKQRLIAFDYRDNRGQVSGRQVEPYRILVKGEDWYLQGNCLFRQAFRTFRILRMRELQMLEEGFAFRSFSESDLAQRGFADKALVPATLRVHISILDQIIARFGEDCLRADEPEHYITEVHIPLDTLAYRYVLGFGSGCECLAPEALRQGVYDLAKEICSIYE